MPTKQMIRFGGEIGLPEDQVAGTRAALEATHSTFCLYGYKNTTYDATADTYGDVQTVFPGYTLKHTAGTAGTTTDNTDDWAYVGGAQTIKYWDYSATAYRFIAYAPATFAVTQTKTDDAVTLTFDTDATQEADMPYISTLWFSNNNYPNYPEYGSPVQLTFGAPICQVRFMLVGADGNPLQKGSIIASAIIKQSLAFKPADGTPIPYAGTLQATYPLTGKADAARLITVQAESATYPALSIPYEEGTANTWTIATEGNKWYNLLPKAGQGDYTFSLQFMSHNGMRSATVPAAYMNWQAGYRYTYVFKITEKDIEFQPQFFVYDKWQAGYSDETSW